MKSRLLIVASLMMFMSAAVFASGSGSYSGGSSAGGGSQKKTDPIYEYGKKLFKGKVKKYSKVKFCLVDDTQESGVKSIKGKTIKPFKGQSYQQLAEQLRNCDDGTQTGLSILERDDMLSLLYFLNKRYRLKLS